MSWVENWERSSCGREARPPLLALFRRGAAEGVLRGDLPAETLLEIFGQLLLTAIDRVTRDHVCVEHASADVTSVFLNGVLAPAPPD